MKSIYNYFDYREYLYDFYKVKKEESSSFSYRLFSDRAGFKSKSFIQHIIDGKKNLSDESTEKLNKVLKLSKKQFQYFKDLIGFNQAKSVSVRNLYFEKLCLYNSRSTSKQLQLQQYDYFNKWYNNSIRELVCHVDFNEDYEKLGRFVKPAISGRDARISVQLLLKLGLIEKNGNKYHQIDKFITTGNEVRSIAVQNFHLQNLNLAGESIDSCPSADREISSLVIGLSEDGFTKYKSEIQNFREKLLDIADKDGSMERVYHVNFQMFPTSEKISDEDRIK